MSKGKLKIAVLGSGNGSNCQSIIDEIEAGLIDAEIVCVISDIEGAGILGRAEKHGIPSHFISAAPYKTKLEGEAEDVYVKTMKDAGADVVVLAGFMRMIKQGLLDAFPSAVLNIHPALLPAFPGMESWKQALDHGAKVAGCTVHFVDIGMDTGPIIVQKVVPILDEDTSESLHARIQAEEHKAFPEALRHIASGKLRVEGRRVYTS